MRPFLFFGFMVLLLMPSFSLAALTPLNTCPLSNGELDITREGDQLRVTGLLGLSNPTVAAFDSQNQLLSCGSAAVGLDWTCTMAGDQSLESSFKVRVTCSGSYQSDYFVTRPAPSALEAVSVPELPPFLGVLVGVLVVLLLLQRPTDLSQK